MLGISTSSLFFAVALLEDDAWVDIYLATGRSSRESTQRLAVLEERKVRESEAKIAKVRDGFEGGLYDLAAARARIQKHEQAIATANGRLQHLRKGGDSGEPADRGAVKAKLRELRERRLREATLGQRRDLLKALGIRCIPRLT